MTLKDFILVFLIAGLLGILEIWLYKKAGVR